jgi:hypothetical protein
LVGIPATVVGMTDGELTTAVWTYNSGSEWIMASFDSTLISGVTLGAAVGDWLPPGYGPFTLYMNLCKLQYWNGSVWVDLTNVTGIVAGQFKTFSWSPIQTTKIRITGPSFVGTVEFKIIPATYREYFGFWHGEIIEAISLLKKHKNDLTRNF